MKKNILLASLVLVVVLSGCVEQPSDSGLTYKNDVITVEDYYVSDKIPYQNSPVTIEFLVKNNGEEAVPRVEVGFPNHPGFKIIDLACEGTIPLDKDGDGTIETCVFDENNDFEELESLDTRSILLTLKAMDLGLLNAQTYTMSYYIEYDYSGFRKMDIPIIDGVTLDKPLTPYSQSTPTYGPIKTEFEMPARAEKVVDDKVVKEYWGVGTKPFKVSMKFTHIGSTSIGNIREPKIEAGKVVLDLRGSLEIGKVGEGDDITELPCDFESSGNVYISKDDLTIPSELVCSFQAVPFEDPETLATIWADFSYTYRYTVSEQFDIQPFY